MKPLICNSFCAQYLNFLDKFLSLRPTKDFENLVDMYKNKIHQICGKNITILE
jgi:hypothetical protein